MVEAFDRKEARDVMDRMMKALDELGVKLNISFTSAGGSITGSRCVFKIAATKLDSDGSVCADRRTDLSVVSALEHAGVKVEGNAIGSIWRRHDGTYAQIVDYHIKRRKYPFEIRKVGEEQHRLAPAGWFKGATQVTSPSPDDFHFWLRVDPDLLSPKDTERYDEVNAWLTLYVPESRQDAFFDTVSDLSERKVTPRLSERVLTTILAPNVGWDTKINQLNQIR